LNKDSAKLTAIVDLPTPPFAEETTTTLSTEGIFLLVGVELVARFLLGRPFIST
jgi:hypothetical protein